MERRDLTVHNDFDNTGGRGEMIKAPIGLQDLRRRLYVKAKAEPSWRFSSAEASAGNGGVGGGYMKPRGYSITTGCDHGRKSFRHDRSHNPWGEVCRGA